jgi:hypothetical protein
VSAAKAASWSRSRWMTLPSDSPACAMVDLQP